MILSKFSISLKSYFIHSHFSEGFFSSKSFFKSSNLSIDLASKKSSFVLFAKIFASSFPIPELAPVIKIFFILYFLIMLNYHIIKYYIIF